VACRPVSDHCDLKVDGLSRVLKSLPDELKKGPDPAVVFVVPSEIVGKYIKKQQIVAPMRTTHVTIVDGPSTWAASTTTNYGRSPARWTWTLPWARFGRGNTIEGPLLLACSYWFWMKCMMYFLFL
jgi:hypothetical protein